MKDEVLRVKGGGNMNPISSIQLIQVSPNGERTPIQVEVSCPAPDGQGAWVCSVALEGLHSKPTNIYGEDSLQVLCLALRFVHSMLHDVLDRGGKLIDPVDGG